MENTVIDNLDPNQNENQVNENAIDVNGNSSTTKKLRFNNLSAKQKNTLLKGGAGLAALILGTGAFSAMSMDREEDLVETEDSSDFLTEDLSEDIYTESVDVVTDAPIASNISSDMTFEEAFKSAREEVGAGGFFTHNDSVYNTFYKEEWDQMTDSEKDDYVNNIADQVHTVEPVTILDNETVSEPIVENTVEDEPAEIVTEKEATETTIGDAETKADVISTPDSEDSPEIIEEPIPSHMKDEPTNYTKDDEMSEENSEKPIGPTSGEDSEMNAQHNEDVVENLQQIKVEPTETIDVEEPSLAQTSSGTALDDLIFGMDSQKKTIEDVALDAADEEIVQSELLNQSDTGSTIINDDPTMEVDGQIDENIDLSTSAIASEFENEEAIELNVTNDDIIDIDINNDFVYDVDEDELVFSQDYERDFETIEFEELPSELVSSEADNNILDDNDVTDIELEDLMEEIGLDELLDNSSDDKFSVEDTDLF